MTELIQDNNKINILRLKDVTKKTGLSRSSIYDKMNPQSSRYDVSFPRQINISPRAVGWYESEINSWLVACVKSNCVPVDTYPNVDKLNNDKLNVEQVVAQRLLERELNEAENLERKRIAIVRQILDKHAKRGAFVLYADVMIATMLSLDRPEDCQAMNKILVDISKVFHLEHKVLITALIQDTKYFKDVFFELARSLGYSCDNPKFFVDRQIRALFEIYEENPDRKFKGRLIWLVSSMFPKHLIRDGKFD
jgi:prophage regulatory protein